MIMFNKNKFNELNSRISYKDEQNVLGISNSYFETLLKLSQNKVLKPQHIPFAFSYIYLQTYLFRYTKYHDYVPTVAEIKEILTYDKTTKTLNYIIKDGGVLDEYNLTKTIYDFPIIHEWKNGGLEFTMLSHFNEGDGYGTKWRQQKNINFKTSCKYPLLAFYSNREVFNGVSMDNREGTFFTTYNLTLIDWNIFNYCMSNDELGCIGFYLYSFVKSQEDKKGKCMMGLNKLSTITGLSTSTISKYIKSLREYNLVQCISATFVVGAVNNDEVEKESNTYYANQYKDIFDDKVEIDNPTFISVTHYLENKRLENVKNNHESVDTDMFDDLF